MPDGQAPLRSDQSLSARPRHVSPPSEMHPERAESAMATDPGANVLAIYSSKKQANDHLGLRQFLYALPANAVSFQSSLQLYSGGTGR